MDDTTATSGWLAAIIESADDAIISKTLEGVVTSWNKAAENIFGYTADEMIGKPILTLLPKERWDEEKEILSKVRSGERVEHYQTVRVTKDGSRIDVMLTVSPIRNTDGKIVGASKILRDVTEQKRTELELIELSQRAIIERDELLSREQKAREQAEVANRAKDEFLGMLSHELRTPLNSILGWTRLLIEAQGSDAAGLEQALEAIDRNAKLQARLIDDMLDVSRIISGKLRLDAQPVDLTNVINAAVDTLRPAADAKQIRLYVTLDFGTRAVLGDQVRLQQVVWNLLSNAIKFTDKNGSVRVSLQRINSHVEVTVSDSGKGIDEAFLPFVFDRFRQEDSTSRKRFGGLGLGLSIVRHLTELHGGTVEAANRADTAGALFTVKLPVMAVSRTADQPDIESSTGQIRFESLPDLAGVKVLAVDDEPDARSLITVLFERCGAEIKTCGTVAEALELLESFEPGVLISDIGLPGEDGYGLIRRIRLKEKSSRKRLPAIALTAFARADDRMKALSAGYNMYVSKPVEPAELALVVYRLMN